VSERRAVGGARVVRADRLLVLSGWWAGEDDRFGGLTDQVGTLGCVLGREALGWVWWSVFLPPEKRMVGGLASGICRVRGFLSESWKGSAPVEDGNSVAFLTCKAAGLLVGAGACRPGGRPRDGDREGERDANGMSGAWLLLGSEVTRVSPHRLVDLVRGFRAIETRRGCCGGEVLRARFENGSYGKMKSARWCWDKVQEAHEGRQSRERQADLGKVESLKGSFGRRFAADRREAYEGVHSFGCGACPGGSPWRATGTPKRAAVRG
jgi:hypothetical protein